MSDQTTLQGDGTLNFSNLMSLATMDTSDLKAQVSRLPRQGIYIEELAKLALTEQPPSDPAKPMSYNLNIGGLILGFAPLKEDADAAGDTSQMEGNNLNERFFLYGEQVKEAIQLLMGRFKIAGFRHKGLMGGVEGSAPGWIDEAVGKRIAVRVRHFTPKDGQERAQFDWLSPKAMEKVGLDWSIMQRPFFDENGVEMDPKDLFGKKKAA
jgi:hypothetical protein